MVSGPQPEVSRSFWIEHQPINLAKDECISNVTDTSSNELALAHSLLEFMNQLQLPGDDAIPKC